MKNNILWIVLALVIGLVIGLVIPTSTTDQTTPTPSSEVEISLPSTAVELTKCVPGMGYHWADPETLPPGPVYILDGTGEVIGLEYLLSEFQMEESAEAGQEIVMDAYNVGFTEVSLTYEPEGLGEIAVPLYALHLYKLPAAGRTGVCNGEELETEGHGDEMTTGETMPMIVGDNAIAVFGQPPADNAVISSVVLGSNGYVVVHRTNSGAPGEIIGSSSLLKAGTHSSVEVALSRAVSDGEELIAMLHTDNGDGEFDAADDSPVRENNAIIMMGFTLDSEADTPIEVSL